MELNYIPKIVIISSIFLVTSVLSEQTHNNHEFDFMLFAQVWPISGCIEWEERNDANTCSLPNRQNWTVHGIWPSKNHKMGPFHCNNSAKFSDEAIKPILEDLKLHWTNVRQNTPLDQFWKHEWDKHGTCAMQLEALDSELKFFQKGLELNKKYPISEYLSESNIIPGGVYTSDSIVKALKKHLNGKNPGLECEKVDNFVNPVLYQISVCIDKQFNIIDCDVAHGGVFGHCPQFDEIEYPKTEKRDQSGSGLGTIFGCIIGSAILIGVLIYMAWLAWFKHSMRHRGYESL